MLMLRLLRVDLPDDTDLPIIKLPSLRSLAMNFRNCESSFVYLFAHLSTPSLECLELIRMNGTHTDEFNAYCLARSLSPKYPNLERLKLFSCGGSDDHMDQDFLAFFPTIISLYRVETKTQFVSPQFPSLEVITFSDIREDQIDWVRDEVEARRANAQPLLRVRVSRYTHSLNERVWLRLRNLVEVVQLDGDSDSLRYTGQSDDDMGDDYKEEDSFVGCDDFSDYGADDWENDWEDEEEEAWDSDY
jgi:hypothetical protein